MTTGLRELQLTSLGGMLLTQEQDIVGARQRARQIAELVGLPKQDQARLATAVSEVARNAFQYGHKGRIEFGLDLRANPQVLWVDATDRGPGIPNLQDVLDGLYQSQTGMGVGLTGTRRLMDYFDVASVTGEGTHVRFGKRLPSMLPRSAGDVETIRRNLQQLAPLSSHEELRRQNQELAEALDSLRSREVDLQVREAELQRLGVELEETNRGVVALYAELDEKATALRIADEMKSRILWHVSHEFRTPVGSILALSQLLLRGTDGPLGPEQQKQVGFIRQAASELGAMVNDLLDLARVDAGMSQARKAPVDVNQFLGSVRGLMRPLLTNENVVLIFEDAEPDLIVETDESKLGQIIRNLISNALKFTEQGEVRLRCQVSDDRKTVKFTVSDTGIGIAPENLERIFQEFAQLESPIQKRVKGTGLGLPLSRKLAKLLDGTLEVSSRINAGSSFVLTLPMPPAPLPPAAESPESEAGDLTILVIDDEETPRYIAKQLFRGSKFRVIEANGGIEGAERARFERPALILLDLIMPDRTGFEVLDELKSQAETAAIPIVIHTSMKLTPSDFERLGGRQRAVLPKMGGDRRAALLAIRQVLQDPSLFSEEPELAGQTNE